MGGEIGIARLLLETGEAEKQLLLQENPGVGFYLFGR